MYTAMNICCVSCSLLTYCLKIGASTLQLTLGASPITYKATPSVIQKGFLLLLFFFFFAIYYACRITCTCVYVHLPKKEQLGKQNWVYTKNIIMLAFWWQIRMFKLQFWQLTTFANSGNWQHLLILDTCNFGYWWHLPSFCALQFK